MLAGINEDMFGNHYAGKRVLVTGHTGFKGAWLSLWLKQLGASVWGLALPAPTHPNYHELIQTTVFAGQIECDIRDGKALDQALARVQPQIIFHLAAQAVVSRSYADPLETFAVNSLGTAQVLEAVRRAASASDVIVVTSDKCYQNRNWPYAYRENDPLGGHDVYSMSKAAAELVVTAWRQSFFLPNPRLGQVVSARGGNVIGGGDYAPDRIVPDCIRSLLAGRPIPVRNPRSTRPWQHVLDCLSGYLWLGACLPRWEKTVENPEVLGAFNFGPGAQDKFTVGELVRAILQHWPGEWTDVSNPEAPHEAAQLSLAIDKAAQLLGWSPTWELPEAIRQTVLWYRQRHRTPESDMCQYSLGQIETFTAAAQQKKAIWTQT